MQVTQHDYAVKGVAVEFFYDDVPIKTSRGLKKARGFYVSESGILYLEPNKKRTHSWLVSNRLQLPFDIINYGSISRISYKNDPVNSQYMQNEEKNAPTALEIAFKKAQDKNNTNNTKFSLSSDNFNNSKNIAPKWLENYNAKTYNKYGWLLLIKS